MLQAIERYMKQAIVDKVPSVSSSALVSSLVSVPCRVGLTNSPAGENCGGPGHSGSVILELSFGRGYVRKKRGGGEKEHYFSV